MNIKNIILCAVLLITSSAHSITLNFWECKNDEDVVLAQLRVYIEKTPEGICHPDILQHRDLYILNVKKRMARLLTQLDFICQGHNKTKLKGYLEQEASLVLGLIIIIFGKKIMSINKFAKYVCLFALPAADLALFLDGKCNVKNSIDDVKRIYEQLMNNQTILSQLEHL